MSNSRTEISTQIRSLIQTADQAYSANGGKDNMYGTMVMNLLQIGYLKNWTEAQYVFRTAA